MKKTFRLLVVGLVALTLSACAGLAAKQEPLACPACGYEFTPPMGGG
jgi:hypothetical protein